MNIGLKEQRKRLCAGVILFALAVGALAVMTSIGLGRYVGPAVFIPLLIGSFCLFQAAAKT